MIALAPGGRLLDDALVDELAAEPALTLLCGRYEGFDERIVEHFCSDVVSIGRYVLAGGELAAMVVCDAVLRKLPGALGDERSAVEESFSAALEGDSGVSRTTRGPPSIAAGACPRCCSPATTSGSSEWRRERSRERGRGQQRAAEPAGAPSSDARRRWRSATIATPRRPAHRLGIPRSSRRPLLHVMSSVIETIERAQLRRVPNFAPGDRVKVHFQVIEGTRRRVQVFEGVVIKRQGHGARETFTVRKQSFGVGVERMFPVHSPKIERIELAARGDVRRAKLYYLRDRVGKRARVRERRYIGPEETIEPGLLHEPPEATDADGMTAEETVLEQDGRREAPERAPSRRRGGRGHDGRGRRRQETPRARRAGGEPDADGRWPARDAEASTRGRGRRRPGHAGDRPAADDADPPRCRWRPGRRRPATSRRETAAAKRSKSTVELDRRAGRDHRSSRSVWRSASRRFVDQALPHPQRLDGAHAVGRPARARQPHRHALRQTPRR